MDKKFLDAYKRARMIQNGNVPAEYHQTLEGIKADQIAAQLQSASDDTVEPTIDTNVDQIPVPAVSPIGSASPENPATPLPSDAWSQNQPDTTAPIADPYAPLPQMTPRVYEDETVSSRPQVDTGVIQTLAESQSHEAQPIVESHEQTPVAQQHEQPPLTTPSVDVVDPTRPNDQLVQEQRQDLQEISSQASADESLTSQITETNTVPQATDQLAPVVDQTSTLLSSIESTNPMRSEPLGEKNERESKQNVDQESVIGDTTAIPASPLPTAQAQDAGYTRMATVFSALPTAAPTLPNKPTLRHILNKKNVAFSLCFIVLAIGALSILMSNHTSFLSMIKKSSSQTSPSPSVSAKDQALANQYIAELGKLEDLPPNETPTVATITDVNKLKQSQPFFNKAQNGNILIIYSTKAYIYDATRHVIVDSAPVKIKNGNNVEIQSPQVSTSAQPQSATQSALPLATKANI